jgi:hypothetical protein
MMPRSFASIAVVVLIGFVPVAGPTQAKRLSVADALLQKWDADHDDTHRQSGGGRRSRLRSSIAKLGKQSRQSMLRHG